MKHLPRAHQRPEPAAPDASSDGAGAAGAQDAAGLAARAPALADALVRAAAVCVQVQDGKSLESALESVLAAPERQAPMGGAVRALAARTVRHWLQVELLLRGLAERAPAAAVAALLKVALAQLLARAYSDFTLVDQTVRAARSQEQTARAAGFANAVLRAFLRARAQWEEKALADPAVRFNVPQWWYGRMQAEYGRARADAALAAQLEEPPLVLRVNQRRAALQEVLQECAQAGIEARRVGPSAIWILHPVPVERIPGFAQGRVSVQDAGAQIAAPVLGVREGMRVLDACAAPGGKTAHLLEIAQCHVDALEIQPARARRIDANLQRLGLEAGARVLVGDALEPRSYWDGRPYDRILLDAPCTASGVVRRHPDVLLLRRPADVAKLATQQAKMLTTLWPLLAPTGRLLYVVCSVFAEEGRRQISAFLRRQPGARLLDLPNGGPGGVQLLPNAAAAAVAETDGASFPILHDGFYYALLEKT